MVIWKKGRLRPPLFFALFAVTAAAQPAAITVEYPREGAVFPPEFPAPTFLWRDPSAATLWVIEAAGVRVRSTGAPMPVGRIDPRCVSPTNQPPVAPPGHSWKPDTAVWDAIRKASPAAVTITGYRAPDLDHPLSRGQVTLLTSTDPVGAPIFYRDVPLMPSETVKGVIQPLAKNAAPLIAWRLRDVASTSSRLVMTGIYSCANCHSASADGKTMGMDLDGPRNDKGLYALFAIEPHAVIHEPNVIAWSTFRGKLGGRQRVGFMSQVSPHGDYVVTTINDPGPEQSQYQRRVNPVELTSGYYVANFKDYRFLQVFYPTRGILAWYSRATGRLQHLPGADDPRYVQTNAVWSPDGQYLVFSRAAASDAYPAGRPAAVRANDPNETPIQYDLYRIPFNEGRGGTAEPIAGASANGMSNSFPKISPDGRWIVFVQAHNGQLMRPDGNLYIVPAAGGTPRLMRCNTPLMNSWHSFSPNGRWMVFSSKSRSPYTQMYLTHIDENGNDTPPILIEDATAANRAVNIPEFLNTDPGAPFTIEAPVTEYYRLVDAGEDLLTRRQYSQAVASLRQAVARQPDEAAVLNSLGVALARTGQLDEAVRNYRKAISLSADFPDAHGNLGAALLSMGRLREAVDELETAVSLNPAYAEAYSNLGAALAQQGRLDPAVTHLRKAVELSGDDANARRNLALALLMTGRVGEGLPHAERAVALTKSGDPVMLSLLGRFYAESGRRADAVRVTQQALALARRGNDPGLAAELQEMLAAYSK